MTIGSLIYGDKRFALSALYVKLTEGMESEDGTLPTLPTAASQGKDRWDLTSPTPTHKRMNEERSLIYTHGIGPMRGRQYTTRNTPHCFILFFLLLYSLLRTNSGIGVPSAHGSQGL